MRKNIPATIAREIKIPLKMVGRRGLIKDGSNGELLFGCGHLLAYGIGDRRYPV